MNNNTWIKRSEREPGISDLPIVTGYRYDGDGWQQSAWFCVPPKTSDSPYTHWRSIKADPPPRELTQRQRDEAAARGAAEYSYNNPNEAGPYAVVSARYAIYAERREVAKWLDAQFGVDWGRGTSATKATREIRARLDEQGGGK